ncbi:MAG: endonuclease/exonuclease/phosphatase family protein [Syntrophobacterales bacterium]|nr:endonuclease/exonuclease/phosphatase family protein [Syntrophobacterales bacterium]
MRVMTFNLRFANPADGPNRWEYRKELVVEVILAHGPDLLATQEGTVPQLDYLAAHLPGYLPLIAHREVDVTCQYPTIFYRSAAVIAQESDEFWLSLTPRIHRSLSWDSAFPRMVTFGLFRERGRELEFLFLDTHLDHISPEARLMGSRMIREHFFPLGRPLILAGDFNEPPDAPVYRELTGPGSPLVDSWRVLHAPGDDPTTQHQFDGQPRGSRIDWILVSPPFQVTGVWILHDHQDGRYPSDHFPYLIEVTY